MLTFVNVNDKDINTMAFDRYYENRNDSFGLKYIAKENKFDVYDCRWAMSGQPVYCGTIHDISLDDWDNMLDCDRNDLIVRNV